MTSGPKLSYLPDFEGRATLYHPLDRSRLGIRVLTIWPSEQFSSPLECTIQVRSALDQHGSYDALSYYWGSANDLEEVLVHGSDDEAPDIVCKVPVTKNLASAMREFRRRATATGEPLVLWTDALCINQRDASERSFQVSAMHVIFQASRRVRVWLGDPISNMAAKNGLESLVSLPEHLGIHAFKFDRELLLGRLLGTGIIQACMASEVVQSVYALMELPYWRRGWALQEATAIRRPISFNFGHQSCDLVDWIRFDKTLLGMTNFAISHNLITGRLVNMCVDVRHACQTFRVAACFRMHDMRHMIRHGRSLSFEPCDARGNQVRSPTLPASLLSAFDYELNATLIRKGWQTTDPRDYILVLSGVHPLFADHLVDYSDTVEQVFFDATILLLRRGGTWSRSFWSHPSQSPYLPSWVIDFSTSSIDLNPVPWECTDGRSSNPLEMEQYIWHGGKFNASADSRLRIKVKTPRTLSTAAFTHGEIAHISRCLTHGERMAGGPDDTWWLQWLRLAFSVASIDTFRIMFTMCTGQGPKQKPLTSLDAHLLQIHPLEGSFSAFQTLPGWGHLSALSDEPERPRPEVDESDLNFWKCRMRDNLLYKRFFITKDGHLGLAPNSAAVGDRIAIFASGDMPFVVRPVHTDADEQAHILVGSCYLEGAMHGGVVDDKAQDVFAELQRKHASPEGRRRSKMVSSLDLAVSTHDAVELSPRKRLHMLRRKRSFDSWKSARLAAVELAFREDLCLA